MVFKVGDRIEFTSGDYKNSFGVHSNVEARIIEKNSDTRITVRNESTNVPLEINFTTIDLPGGAVYFNINEIKGCIENPAGEIVERIKYEMENPGQFKIVGQGGGRYRKRKSKRRKSKKKKSKKNKSKTRRRRR